MAQAWSRPVRIFSEVNTSFADSTPGPVTDYGSGMVQWMRHRQPKYKGGVRMEVERPSPSYVVDVCESYNERGPSAVHNLSDGEDGILDPATSCKATESCRFDTCETPTLLFEQA